MGNEGRDFLVELKESGGRDGVVNCGGRVMAGALKAAACWVVMKEPKVGAKVAPKPKTYFALVGEEAKMMGWLGIGDGGGGGGGISEVKILGG